MPTYGYECLGCGRAFETYQRITEDSLTKCDVCEGDLRKKVFPVGIVFKGSGFYVNDYAKKAAESVDTAAAKTDGATAQPAAVGAETTTVEAAKPVPESKTVETKPEAPAPAAPTTPSV